MHTDNGEARRRRAQVAAFIFLCFGIGLVGTFVVSAPLRNGAMYAPQVIGAVAADTASAGDLTMVFIGSPYCGPSRNPALAKILPRLAERLQQLAVDHGLRFHTVGVSPTSHAQEGFAYLAGLHTFEQVTAGGSERNAGLLHFATQNLRGTSATPQLVVVLRTRSDGNGLKWDETVLTRKLGVGTLADWFEAGAPLSLDRYLGARQ